MAYRNDHDAALARVDALVQDVSRLEAENAALRAARPAAPTKARLAKFLIAGWIGLIVVGSIVDPRDGAREEERVTVSAELDVNRAQLDRCIQVMDPSVGGPCVRNLHALTSFAEWSPIERSAVATWSAAEDEVTTAAIDHADPVAFEHAITHRNAAVAMWQSLR